MNEGSNRVVLMFIPHELDIEGQPELRKFPTNVLFVKIGVRKGVLVIGRATYEPDLASLDKSESQYTLIYKNKHGGDCWLRITYDADREVWEGEKNVNRKIVGSASGSEWKGFFSHFTLLGLVNGERCIMQSFPEMSSRASVLPDSEP